MSHLIGFLLYLVLCSIAGFILGSMIGNDDFTDLDDDYS